MDEQNLPQVGLRADALSHGAFERKCPTKTFSTSHTEVEDRHDELLLKHSGKDEDEDDEEEETDDEKQNVKEECLHGAINDPIAFSRVTESLDSSSPARSVASADSSPVAAPLFLPSSSTISIVSTQRSTCALLLNLFSLGSINGLGYLAQQVMNMLMVVMLGHLNSQYMAAAALGNMYANVTGFSIGIGLTSALDTLCSQAYGAAHYHLVGLHTQRGLVIISLFCIPVAVVWLTAYPVLSALGMGDEVSYYASVHTRILIIGMFANFAFEIFRKYLQARQIVWPTLVAVCMQAITAITFGYVFIFHTQLEFKGAAFAVVVSQWTSFITLISCIAIRAYVIRRRTQRNHYHKIRAATAMEMELTEIDMSHDLHASHMKSESESSELAADPEETWPAWSRDVFRNWKEFLRLGLPSALSLFLEWGSFEISAFMAGTVSTSVLAAHAAFMQSVGIFYAFPLGCGIGAAAMIGNALGANNPLEAKRVAKLSSITLGVFGAVNGCIFTQLLAKPWCALFTTDEEVQSVMLTAFISLWPYTFWDCLKCAAIQILRGVGKPQVTVWGNVLSCYLIFFPMALLFILYFHWSLTALWLSMTSAWLSATLIYNVLIFRLNWQHEADEAKRRNERSLAEPRAAAVPNHSNTDKTNENLTIPIDL